MSPTAWVISVLAFTALVEGILLAAFEARRDQHERDLLEELREERRHSLRKRLAS